MIGLLRGQVWEKSPNQVILDVGGVGYQVTIPISTFTALPGGRETVTLRIHTHVREDALVLFGFATEAEQQLFEKLIAVSGIGPKLAITVLSGLAWAELAAAIRQNDVARLVRIPGVGKKTAERIVLELKDKLTGFEPEAGQRAQTAITTEPSLSAMEQDVLSALQNLGCSRPAAEEAIRKVNQRGAPEDFEHFFRSAMALVR